MTEPDGRAATIKKLLNKAEAKGTTPEERDAFSAKATELMLKWGIEEAALADADRAKIEHIIQRQFSTDVPKSYSYEVAAIGVAVATAFGCRGFFQKMSDGRVNVTVVGFESDVERVRELYTSLAIQATLDLASWFASVVQPTWWNGTDKFNAKRSFLRGFASGVASKFATIKQQVIADAVPGTDIVLINRVAKIDLHVKETMVTSVSRSRRYTTSGTIAGHHAGQRADIGQTATGTHYDAVGG